MKKTISIIIPVLNERENLRILQKELEQIQQQLPIQEILYVDDGSVDGSCYILEEIASVNPSVKCIFFSRTYGQTAALGAGIKQASGSILVTLDADLQNDPHDIPLLIQKLNEGYDIVSGWRKERNDAPLRTFISRAANKIIAFVTNVNINDYGCTLKAYRAEIVKAIDFFGEVHRLIPAYAFWHGARVTEIVVHHRPRLHGISKYGFSRIFRVILDLLVVKYFLSFSQRPIYFFGYLGLLSILGSFISFFIALGLKLFLSISLVETPLILLTVLLFISALQLLSMGILADVIFRTRSDKERTVYRVRKTIGL